MRTAPWQLLPLLLLAGCSAATARSLSVSDDEGLQKAVASARSGDRITLAPGVYAPLSIRDRAIEGAPVTIVGKGARIAAVAFEGSRGWALEDLELGGAVMARNRVVLIQNSGDIAVRNSLIRGMNPNKDPWDDAAFGVGLRRADKVEIVGNRFRDLGVGFIAGTSSNILFQGNSIAYVREGSDWVAIKTATIRCNRYSHIFPNWLRKEHPDAIQGWWTGDGNNENFLIEGNVLMLGGPRAVQGFFLAGSIMPDGEKYRLRNITIRDNIYYGSSRHGISITGVENVVIERNTILPSPHAQQDNPPPRSEDGRRSSALLPRIAVIGPMSTGRVAGNIAAKLQLEPQLDSQGNVTLPPQGGKAWARAFAVPPTGDDPSVADFRSRSDAGARPICGSTLPAPVEAPSGPDPSTAGQQTVDLSD
jgi:hypothetical protein